MQPDSCLSNNYKIHSNSQPVLKTSVLMPSNVKIHRQVLLNDAKSSKEIKTALFKLLQKYDTIILKSDSDIDQTGLIEMHIATRPDPGPIAA